MALESRLPGYQGLWLLALAQRYIDHICQRQAICIGRAFNCEYFTGACNDAIRQEKPHRQIKVVSRCAHNHGQAATGDTYFERLFNRQIFFALLLLIFVPVRHLDIHHALRIELRAPEARNDHLFPAPLFIGWYGLRPGHARRYLQILPLEVVFTGAGTYRVWRLDGYQAPTLLLQPAPCLIFFIKVTHNIACNRKHHRTQKVTMLPAYHSLLSSQGKTIAFCIQYYSSESVSSPGRLPFNPNSPPITRLSGQPP